MMGANIHLPTQIWKRLNLAWMLYFAVMGTLNLYIAYTYSTDIWVNFKLFGGAGCMLFFVILQALYLTRHATVVEGSSE